MSSITKICNLYTYCDNAPKMFSDPFGFFRFKAWILASAIDTAFALLNYAMMAWGGLIAGIIDWFSDKSLNGWIVI